MNENDLSDKREAVRKALQEYERELYRVRESVPRGSGHATNDFDQLSASITEVRIAQRVLWMVP